MNHSLDINDWNKFIYNKKLILINEIEKNNTIDKSLDSIKFNNILKDLAKSNIFNISYIAFMTLKFLETTFIPTEIILNTIGIYNNDEMYKLLFKNNYLSNNTVNKLKYIKTLIFIIKNIIDFVVKTELSLNIQCLLITDFIDKIDKDYYKDDAKNVNECFKPHIFKMFNKINKNTITYIKPSTRILLIFKLLSKLGINNYNESSNNNYDNYDNYYLISSFLESSLSQNDDNDEIKDNDDNSNGYDNESDNENMKYLNSKFTNYINTNKEINKKTKLYLDTFMLDITNFFDNNNNNLDSYQNIYSICSKYILNNTELVFNNFQNIFSVLEDYILKNINENIKHKLYYLRNVIKNLIDIEIDNIKKLFCV